MRNTLANDGPDGANEGANGHAAAGDESLSLARRFRAACKQALLAMLYRCGALHLTRRLFDRKTLTVAMFHRVLPLDSEACLYSEREYVVGVDEFDHCLRFFKRHFNVVTLEQVREARDGGRALPAHALLISFDDGWHDNVVHAEPLLRRHGLKATLFVNVEAIEQPGRRWWQDALVEVAQHRGAALEALGPRADFFAAARSLIDAPLDQRLSRLAPWSSYEPAERQMMTPESIAKIDRSVWEVGSHGLSHVPFTAVADVATEMTESASRIGRWYRGKIDALSFPHGRYDGAMLTIARASGYRLVFSSDPAVNRGTRALSGVIGRVHIPSQACSSDSTLARFLWCRQVA
ncbi:MAG: polysaccharide deacetylase family protein [Burkholderiaceae bacterium]